MCRPGRWKFDLERKKVKGNCLWLHSWVVPTTASFHLKNYPKRPIPMKLLCSSVWTNHTNFHNPIAFPLFYIYTKITTIDQYTLTNKHFLPPPTCSLHPFLWKTKKMGASLLPKKPAFLFSFITFCLIFQPAFCITRHYKFDVCVKLFIRKWQTWYFSPYSIHSSNLLQIKLQNVTRLCHTKTMVTVNGKFPGPRIVAREGDQLLIKVVNHVQNNISLHW